MSSATAASTPLERAEKQLTDARYTLNGHTWNLQDYLKRENVSGMLVLKDGKVAWKYLAEGNTDTTLWTSRSVGKSVVSTLVGIAIQQGKIHSLDDLITVYEPELKGDRLGRRNAEAVDSTHQRGGME